MTRVDFYILAQAAKRSDEQLACSLAMKAWQQKSRLYIHTEDQKSADQIDGLLWSFNECSFLPHGQVGQDTEEKTPILIGYQDPPAGLHDIMLNMTRSVPDFFGRFDRLIEIVNQANTQHRSLGRERYRFYQERGYPLNTHTLDS